MKDTVFAVVKMVKEKLKDPYYHGKPAELAFYFMMSIVPTILLLVQLLAAFSISSESLQRLFGDYLSGKGLSLLQVFLDNSESSEFSLIFIIFALWGSSMAQFALIGISNYAHTGNPRVNGYIFERLRAIKNSLLMLFSFLFGLILLVYGDSIIKAVLFISGDAILNTYERITGHSMTVILSVARWILGFIFYNVAVAYVLYNAPQKKLKLRQVFPGSLVTSIGLVIVTAVYSQYTNFTLRDSGFMNTIYGSFSSVIALLLWFFLLGGVLVLGILTNASLQFLGIEDTD